MTTMTANASSNYSQEVIDNMVAEYTANPTRETVDALAESTGKTVRSVISKLSALGVYVKAEKAAKKAEPQIKKEVFVEELQTIILNKGGHVLPSLNNMTKVDIQNLIAVLG